LPDPRRFIHENLCQEKRAPEGLCVLLAVTVLEQLGTPPARELLDRLAEGALLTEEAKTARNRLRRLDERK
jgi:hypothetical protein